MRREIRLGRDEQIRREQRRRNERTHPARAAHAGEETRRPGEVDHVVDIKSISRPLAAADAGERPVEAVAEPIDPERDDDCHGAPWAQADRGKSDTRGHHRPQS